MDHGNVLSSGGFETGLEGLEEYAVATTGLNASYPEYFILENAGEIFDILDISGSFSFILQDACNSDMDVSNGAPISEKQPTLLDYHVAQPLAPSRVHIHPLYFQPTLRQDLQPFISASDDCMNPPNGKETADRQDLSYLTNDSGFNQSIKELLISSEPNWPSGLDPHDVIAFHEAELNKFGTEGASNNEGCSNGIQPRFHDLHEDNNVACPTHHQAMPSYWNPDDSIFDHDVLEAAQTYSNIMAAPLLASPTKSNINFNGFWQKHVL